MQIEYNEAGSFLSEQSDITGKLGEVDTLTLVKEIVQNSLDAKLQNNEPVEVKFQVIRVPASIRMDVLERIGLDDVDSMIENLSQMKKYSNNDSHKFKAMIDLLEEEGDDLYLLTISDYNTYGLDGDDKLSLDIESRFQGYNYKLGLSEKVQGLGSFGEGRMAALYASDIQYVYQISNLDQPWDDFSFREFGLGIHGIFQHSSKIYSGVFFCGEKNPSGKTISQMSNSVSETFSILSKDRMDRTGTSFIFPFFNPRKLIDQDDEEDDLVFYIESFLEEIKLSMISTFFPSITRELLILKAEYVDLGSKELIQFSLNVGKNEIPPILRKITQKAVDEDDEFYVVREFEETIDIKIPVGKSRERIIEKQKIRFLEIREDEIEPKHKKYVEDLLNKVICCRNGMMIQLFDPSKKIVRLKSFIGLLDVQQSQNEEAHNFLRLSEPVKHNEWKKNSPRLIGLYGKTRASRTVNHIFSQITEIINENFGLESFDEEEVPLEVTEDLLQSFGLDKLEYHAKRKKNRQSPQDERTSPSEDEKIDIENPYVETSTADKHRKTLPTSEKRIAKKTKRKAKPKKKRANVDDDETIRESIDEPSTIEISFPLQVTKEERKENSISISLEPDEGLGDLFNIKVRSWVTSEDGKISIEVPNKISNGKNGALQNSDFPISVVVNLESIPPRLWDIAKVQFEGIGLQS